MKRRLFIVILVLTAGPSNAQGQADFDALFPEYARFVQKLSEPWSLLTHCPTPKPAVRQGDACAKGGGGFTADRANGKKHLALDLESSLRSGAEVRAAGEGTVVVSADWPRMGSIVILEHSGGYYTLYGHLASRQVAVGKSVGAGETIGIMGYSGNASCLEAKGLPAHVHFAVYGAFPDEGSLPRRLRLWAQYRDEETARYGDSGRWGPLDPTLWLGGCND